MVKKIKKWINEDPELATLFVILLTTILALGMVVGPNMYSASRIMLLMYQIPEFGLIALGMTLAFLMGGTDLSLIANANMSGIICAFILSGSWFPSLLSGIRIVVAVAIGISVGAIGGVVNGVLISKFSVPPMIATLSTMTFYNGVSMALTGGKSIMDFPEAFNLIGKKTLANIPMIFLLFVLVSLTAELFLSRTVLGRKIYLYGSNPVATRFSSVNTERLLIAVFAINGFLAGLSGLIMTSRVTTAKVGYGEAYTVQAMLVAVIGGISPNGGKGKTIGILVAILIIQLLASAFTIWQLSPYNRKLIWGSLLLLVLLINYVSAKFRNKKTRRKF